MSSLTATTSWRCPHCGQLQSGTARCWRCERVADACSTCHRFRRAVANELGYCADDRTRSPLGGDEVRPCWEAAPALPSAPGLFGDLDTLPVRPTVATPDAAPAPSPHRRPAKAAKPPLEEPQAAAWAEIPMGRLTEAPSVEPVRRSSPAPRRRPRWGLR